MLSRYENAPINILTVYRQLIMAKMSLELHCIDDIDLLISVDQDSFNYAKA
jgi:hypothetical protein